LLKKQPKKPDKTICGLLYDGEGKEVLLSHNVYSRHLAEAAHDEAYEYYETLKANLAHPDSVKLSKTDKRTKIANLKLINRKHPYLRVVIRYNTVWHRLLGARNYIVTFYGADSPIDGEEVCLNQP